MVTGSKVKCKSGGHVTKNTSEKSKNVMISGSKKAYSNTVTGKSASGSLGDKKSNNALSLGKNNYSASSSEKNKSSTIGIKPSSPYSGKSASNSGKNATTIFGDTAGTSKSNKISNSILQQTTAKNDVSPSITNSKNKKSSMTFGIIWLPTKKRNKLKHNTVYNPYDNDKRDRFKERSPSMYNFTSGDTSNHQVFIKKEEESHLLVPDKLKVPVGAAAMTSDSLPVDIAYVESCSEQQGVTKHNNDDMKEAAGDSYVKKNNDDYLENNESSLTEAPDAVQDKKEDGDKVDGGCVRVPTPSPPDKTWRSNASIMEEEDWDIKCLYYTLICCDCVIS